MWFFGKGEKVGNAAAGDIGNRSIVNTAIINYLHLFDRIGGWFWHKTPKSALQVNMFYACVRLLSNAVATTPINIINKNDKPVNLDLQFLLKNKPNTNQTAFDFWQQVMFDLLVFGNCYVIKNTLSNRIESMQILRPEFMQVEWTKRGGKLYKYSTVAGVKELNQDNIIHYKMLSLDGLTGLKPLDLLIDSFNVSGKLNKFLQDDKLPPVLKTPEHLMQDKQVEEITDDLVKKLPEKPIVLPKDFELLLSNSQSAFDKKFAELKKFTNEEIARFFNIPFGLVGLDGASQPNVLDTQNRILLQYALNPYLKMIEQTTENALFNRDELNNGFRVKFNRNAITMQTDANARADYYGKMLALPIEKPLYDYTKIKQLEDL